MAYAAGGQMGSSLMNGMFQMGTNYMNNKSNQHMQLQQFRENHRAYLRALAMNKDNFIFGKAMKSHEFMLNKKMSDISQKDTLDRMVVSHYHNVQQAAVLGNETRMTRRQEHQHQAGMAKLNSQLELQQKKDYLGHLISLGNSEGISTGTMLLGAGGVGASNKTRSSYTKGSFRKTSIYDNQKYTGTHSQNELGAGIL